MRMSGHTTLVTGAGSGIGKAIALAFAENGASVAINDVSPARAQAVADEITRIGGHAETLPGDVSDGSAVAGMLASANERLGSLTCLVNNAGVELIKPVTDTTESDWDWLMDTNVKGAFFGCKYAIPLMQERGGSVINIASGAGLIGQPLLSAYCASKGAVIQLTRALSQEHKGSGLRFNAVCPTLVRTELGQRFIDRYEQDFNVPISTVLTERQGRLGTPNDVANAAIFLATEESNFVNGHCLVLDGGGLAG